MNVDSNISGRQIFKYGLLIALGCTLGNRVTAYSQNNSQVLKHLASGVSAVAVPAVLFGGFKLLSARTYEGTIIGVQAGSIVGLIGYVSYEVFLGVKSLQQ